MTNEIRGDVEVKLDDETYTMRSTFEAICEIEDATGKGVMMLLEKVSTGDISMKEAAVIIYSGLGGYDRNKRPSFNKVGAAVRKLGIPKILPIISVFLIKAVSGDADVDTSEITEKN